MKSFSAILKTSLSKQSIISALFPMNWGYVKSKDRAWYQSAQTFNI